jgi:hypothetical protein
VCGCSFMLSARPAWRQLADASVLCM